MKAFVMVGAPASGKTTYSRELVLSENATIISGDEVRKELYGSSDIQGKWVEINDRIEEYVAVCAERSFPVVLDGTHYLSSYRKEALALLRSYGFDEVVAVVLNPPLETCLARNSRRKRHVPDYIIKGMYEKLQPSLAFIDTEGFTEVVFA